MVWTGVEVALLRFVLIFQLSPAISRVSSASIQDGFDSVWPPSGPAKEMLPSKTSSSEKGTHEETLNSASSRYLLGVYNRLRVGESLLQATGEQSVKPLAVLHSDTVRTLKATVTWVRGRQLKMTFSTSSVPSTEKLQLAELRVRHPRRHCGNSHHGNRMIKVKYFNEQGKRFASKIYPIELYKDSSEDMSALDVTQVLQESHGVAANVELILKCDKSKTNHNKVVRTKRDIFHGMESGDAFILIFSKSGDIFKNLDTASNSSLIDTRPKRELETALQTKGGRKRNKNKRKDCSRRKFYIDFKALGWSQWIIYPKRFNAYYCGGECPLPVDQYYEPTNHAVMQSLMKLRRPDSRVPAPCCVPGKLSPLSMLYFENEDIVVRHHEGMVVDRCSCK